MPNTLLFFYLLPKFGIPISYLYCMDKDRIRNNEKFQKALNSLNDKQREAVNKIEGPVLVVAGPGTGKTQILAARIGQILLHTDTDAHNILCLTYTDAGTIAMRKRLYDFIGPDAYRVHIYTFHAFCNDIIQENLDYFGKLNLEPISELEQAALFKELIDTLSNNSKLKKYTGDVYYEASRMKNLYSTMKRENWTVDFLLAKIEDYIKDLPNRDEFIYKRANAKTGVKVGDVKTADIKKITDRLDLLKAAINEYPRYLKKMHELNRYDYDDMIVWVLNAFKADENLLRNYQEKYQYILVDEYQDTSGSQNEILRLLISYWDQPNIFVVGDDDQSIYRFQGANINNILDYANEYSEVLHKIVLTNNYRSTQSVLNVSKTLIENNFERLTKHLNLDKNLLASNELYSNMTKKALIREYETPMHELVHIAEEIKSLIKNGVEPKEIAILYRNHAQAAELVNYLQNENIGINIKRKEDILSLAFTEKIVNILRYIASERDTPYSGDDLLFQIMHYDFFNLEPIDIAKISVDVAHESYKQKTSIRKKLTELAKAEKVDLFNQNDESPLKRFSSDIEFWIKESFNYTLQELFEKIILRAGILNYIMHSENRAYYMDVLSTLFNYLKEENRKNPEMDVAGFVEMIDLMVKNGIRLEINKSSYNENGVNFMTAHGSKGLEFDYVYIISVNKKIWDVKKGSNREYSFPDNIFTSIVEGSELEESRRLFYVALTRAKHSLNISYCAKDASGKDLESSQFIAEIKQSDDYEFENVKLNEDLLFKFQSIPFLEQPKPVIELLDKNYIDILLEGYTLSVTHLSNYLDCPLKFYFQNLVRVPSGKSPSATFGQAVHWALNKLFKNLKDNNEEFADASFLVDQFKWYMNRNRDSFTKEEYKRRVEYGEKILPEYYATHVNKWNKITLTEHPVKNVEVNGVPIKGNLDKIEFNGKQVNVVDYKTGKYKNALEKVKAPSEENELGGDYWRQAVFYKILIDNDRSKDWEVVSTVFEFIEPVDLNKASEENNYPSEKIVITNEAIEIVKSQITSTYQKILNHEFNTGCGKEECHWCKFVKTNFKEQDIMIAEE